MSCNNGMSFIPSSFMIQNSYEDDHPHQSPSLAPLLPSCSLPQDLNGFASFIGKQMLEEEYSDDGSQMGEKKRRLNMEQVQTLEKAFELGNKLEPERKTQLARALGLQPRQIGIWFQNRRARWKTKQLEKDYDTLKLKFDALKAENDRLQTHNQKLQAEIMGLQNKEQTESINLNKETEGSCSNRSDNLYATASINRKHNNGRSPTADSWSTLLPTVTSHRNDHNNDVAVLPKLVFRTEYG